MPNPPSQLDLITLRLDELLRTDPHLAQPVAYFRALSTVLQSGQPLAPLPVSKNAFTARLATGQPLLYRPEPVIEILPSIAFFRQVCQVIAAFQPGASQVIAALDEGRLDVPTLLAEIAAGVPDQIETAAEFAEVSPLTLRMLLEYTLRPTLRAWAAQLLENLNLEDWQRSTCPVCGSLAFLGELHKTKRLRLLRCGVCGTAWPYPILQCVYCANQDPTSQGLLSADEEDEHTFAQFCKRCQVYIKTILTESPIPADLLALEDLATLYLDQGCQDKGYTRLLNK
jgi:hypothetical protein